MSSNLLELTNEQLAQLLAEKEYALVSMRFKLSMNQLENTASLRVVRKEISRLKTETRRREIEKGIRKGQLFSAVKSSVSVSPEANLPKRGGFLRGIVDKLTGAE